MSIFGLKSNGDWFRVIATKNYFINNDSTPTVQTRKERLNNFPGGSEATVSEVIDLDPMSNLTRTTLRVDRSAKKTTEEVDTPESSTNAVRVTVNGLLESSNPTTPETAMTYGYDALGRLVSTTDPQHGTTSRAYIAGTGQLSSVSDAVGSTSYEYYPSTHASAGRLKFQTNAAGKKVYFGYSSRGELLQTWGEATLSVGVCLRFLRSANGAAYFPRRLRLAVGHLARKLDRYGGYHPLDLS